MESSETRTLKDVVLPTSVDEGYVQGMNRMMEPGASPSFYEWVQQLTQMLGGGLAMRGGVGNPLIRFPLEKGQMERSNLRGLSSARRSFEDLAYELPGDMATMFDPGSRIVPLNTKALTLGRSRTSDTFKPGRGAVGETTDPEMMRKLLDVLWSHTEIPPKYNLPW